MYLDSLAKWLRTAGVLISMWGLSGPAAAAQEQQEQEEQGIRVGVLFSTQGEFDELAQQVDAELLSDLSSIAGIDNPEVSPIEYKEIRLTIGCEDQSRGCLSSIAETLQVDAIIVRELKASSENSVTLSLLYFDASSGEDPRKVEIESKSAETSQAVIDTVPGLVRELFGIPEPAAPSEPEPKPEATPAQGQTSEDRVRPQDPPPTWKSISTLTWVALGTGAAVLTAGLLVGVSASDTFSEYKQMSVVSDEDIRRANAKFDEAESTGTIATVLIPVGSIILAAGGALLLLDLWGGDQEKKNDKGKLGVIPLRHGAMFVIDGALRESL